MNVSLAPEPPDDGDVFDQLESFAEPAKKWTPKEPLSGENAEDWIVSESVAGIVEYLEPRGGDYGDYIAAELRQKDGGRIQVAGFGIVLGGWFPTFQIGDAVSIAYKGTRQSSRPGVKPYDDFQVVCIRDGKRVSRAVAVNEEATAVESDDLPMPTDA